VLEKMVVGFVGSRRSVTWVAKEIGPICTLTGAGTGVPAGVGDGGTKVGVADGTRLGVRVGGTGVEVGTTGGEVAGGDAGSLGGDCSVSGTT
jgi:hypothetical protein